MHKFHALKKWNSILLIGVVVLAFIIACIFYLDRIKRNLYNEIVDRITNETIHVAALIQSELQRSLEEVVAVSYSLSNQVKSKEEILQFLKFFASKNNYLRFSYYDLQGNLTTTDDIFGNIYGSYTYKKNVSMEPAISKPTEDTSGSTEIIAFSAPVPLHGTMHYGIVGSRYLDTVLDKLTNNFYDGKGHSFIATSNGEVLVHSNYSDTKEFEGTYFEKIEFESKDPGLAIKLKTDFAHKKSGVISFSFKGETKIVSYTPLEGINDWYLLCAIPNYSISSNQKSTGNSMIMILVLIASLSIIVFIKILFMEKNNRKQIEKLAYYDELTGAKNLAKFKIDAEEMLKKHKDCNFAVIKFDIINFKLVNDIFGFKIGDKVLINLAKSVSSSLAQEEIFSRSSNDNFVVMIQYNGEDEILRRGGIFLKTFHEMNKNVIANQKIHLSIGVSKWNGTDNIAVLLEKATMAQKVSKKSGKQTLTMYDDRIREDALKANEIENSMHQALSNSEFVVYMQPKFGLSSEKIEGAEALVRWIHPTKGIIAPANFIPLFERNGFIVEIDLFVLEEACKLQRKLLDDGVDIVPISVNQSKVLMNSPNYVNIVHDIVKKYNIPPNAIEIELTETTFQEDMESLLQITNKLLSLGFGISIDDFGSGYSSLNFLKQIPASVLKIDKEFLNKTEDDERGQTVLANMIRLAKELQMTVVTEGVETLPQASLLKSLECDMAQGYLYSKPIPISEFEKLFPKN